MKTTQLISINVTFRLQVPKLQLNLEEPLSYQSVPHLQLDY